MLHSLSHSNCTPNCPSQNRVHNLLQNTNRHSNELILISRAQPVHPAEVSIEVKKTNHKFKWIREWNVFDWNGSPIVCQTVYDHESSEHHWATFQINYVTVNTRWAKQMKDGQSDRLPCKFERHSDNQLLSLCVQTIPTFLEDETNDSVGQLPDMALWCDTCWAPTKNTKNPSATPTESPSASLSLRNSVPVIWLHRAPTILVPGNLNGVDFRVKK